MVSIKTYVIIFHQLDSRDNSMSLYQYHVFVCTNKREEGKQSCHQCDAQGARDYMKKRCKELGIHGHQKNRINTAGCLDRCEQGPVIVIYPEEIWYTYIDKEDLDEIIEEHLINGKVVERLKI